MPLLPQAPGQRLLREATIFGDFLRDGSQSADMNVDGSSTEVVFQTQAQPQNRSLLIHHAHVSLIGSDMRWFDSFGSLPALTNGVVAEVFDRASGDTLVDLTVGSPWKHTADVFDGIGLSILSGSLSAVPGADRMEGQFSFSEVFGAPFWLPSGEGIRVIVRDDLSGLDAFRILVAGFYVTV